VKASAGRHPRTAAYVEAILARPSFADILCKDQAVVTAMGGPVTAQQAA
jgi:glutathione S-transferase